MLRNLEPFQSLPDASMASTSAIHLSFRKHPAFQVFLSRENGLLWITYAK